jgi:hypothetical protein
MKTGRGNLLTGRTNNDEQRLIMDNSLNNKLRIQIRNKAFGALSKAQEKKANSRSSDFS